jgi:hypothetical protein
MLPERRVNPVTRPRRSRVTWIEMPTGVAKMVKSSLAAGTVDPVGGPGLEGERQVGDGHRAEPVLGGGIGDHDP